MGLRGILRALCLAVLLTATKAAHENDSSKLIKTSSSFEASPQPRKLPEETRSHEVYPQTTSIAMANASEVFMADVITQCNPTRTVFFFSPCFTDTDIRTGVTIVRDVLVNAFRSEAGIFGSYSYAILPTSECPISPDSKRLGPWDLLLTQDSIVFPGEVWVDVVFGSGTSVAREK